MILNFYLIIKIFFQIKGNGPGGLLKMRQKNLTDEETG
jgi:hypothetical protein